MLPGDLLVDVLQVLVGRQHRPGLYVYQHLPHLDMPHERPDDIAVGNLAYSHGLLSKCCLSGRFLGRVRRLSWAARRVPTPGVFEVSTAKAQKLPKS